MSKNLIERFLLKISVSDTHFYNDTACQEWIGSKTNDGYGQFGVNGKTLLAHRVAYEYFKGKIPQGLQLDHLCRNRKCVNTEHLEAVTQQENILKGIGVAAQNAVKTHCPQEHEYTKENTYIYPSGFRACIICRRSQNTQHYQRKKLEMKIFV